MMAQEYNGHKTKGHWNVSLWIGNDEPIYRAAMECIRGAKIDAARGLGGRRADQWLSLAVIRFRQQYGNERTPDGFKYTSERIRAALADLDS